MVQLSSKDKTLVHLFEQRRECLQDSPAETITQDGISSALGVPRTHITRLLRPLIEEGLIEEEKKRVAGKERRMKVYVLTPSGLARSKDLVERLSSQKLEVVENRGKRFVLASDLIKERPDIPMLVVFESIGKELNLISAPGRVIQTNTPLELPSFQGRKGELRAARSFLASASTALVVFANFGYGSSTFLKKVALDLTDIPLLWHDLGRGRDLEEVQAKLGSFAKSAGCERGEISELREKDVLLCFDNYHDVSEQVVDAFFDFMKALKGGKAKMAVAMREETPSYNRFFQKADVEKGHVAEIHLPRFDEESARELIGQDIDDEAFQLIYRLTRGQPLALELVRRGDEKGLKALRPNEEVRFLMYLRSSRKKQ